MHPVKSYVDGTKFRKESDELLEAVRSEVIAKINDAMSGFNTRAQNASFDYNQTISTEDEATEFSDYISDYSTKLSDYVTQILDKVNSLVEDHLVNRPLLRSTGNRSVPSKIDFDSVSTISYEFQNVGNKSWSGWMKLVASDKYKHSISVDFPPSQIPVVAPGDVVVLSREITIPKTVIVDGNLRSWADKTSFSVSIYTRGV